MTCIVKQSLLLLLVVFALPRMSICQNLSSFGLTGIYFGMSQASLIDTHPLAFDKTDSIIDTEGSFSKDNKYYIEKTKIVFKNLSYCVQYLFINDQLCSVNIFYNNCLDFANVLFQLKKEFKKIKSVGAEYTNDFERIIKMKHVGKSGNIQMVMYENFKVGSQNVYLYSTKFDFLFPAARPKD